MSMVYNGTIIADDHTSWQKVPVNVKVGDNCNDVLVAGYEAAAVGYFGRPGCVVQLHEIHESRSFSERPAVLSVHWYVDTEVPS